MNILFATSEVVPFCKTGGLADVSGALPREIAKLGHEISIILPAYKEALDAVHFLEQTPVQLEIEIGSKIVQGGVAKTQLPGSEVTVYLVQQDEYFARDGLYQTDGSDFIDNCERFIFYSRAVLETIRQLNLKVDVIHANDWTTGLIPAFLEIDYRPLPGFGNIATLYTIHNLAYQGTFWHWDMLLTGIDWKYFNWRQMEFYGKLNLMKTGLSFSNCVSTVSERYAEEIQTAEFGCGLEGLLQSKREYLSGIINGIDYSVWNPATDSFLPANFDVDSIEQGKAECKSQLQKTMGLPVQPDIPLIGIVGRLAEQKGIDLISEVLRNWLPNEDAQWVILGTGDPKYHHILQELQQEYPNRLSLKLAFSEELAHQIEAGSDMFLMPSRYEPCGLNQLYSLKYGTLPVVRETGGLADTVLNLTEVSRENGTASGFSFQAYHDSALSDCLKHACETYRADRTTWNVMVKNAMNQDWSWTRSAQKYIELYEKTIAVQQDHPTMSY